MRSLQQRKRAATVEHLVWAAVQGLAEHGLDVTVEQIAAIAGVSRRTVFHHFAGRDDLLGAAVVQGQTDFEQSLPEYSGDGDWRRWIADLCYAVHVTNASYGRALWELLAQESLRGTLADAVRRIAERRRGRNLLIVQTLWNAMGYDAQMPETFRATVVAHLSPFFTLSVTRDAGADQRLAPALAQAAIIAAGEAAAMGR